MTKGIIIFALGHENYLHMATALAASLRYNEPDVNICLLTDSKNKDFDKTDIGAALFSTVKVVPDKYFIEKSKVLFNKAMLNMYQLSPYDQTIKLDADMIWLQGRKPSEIFDQLADVDITFMNRGHGSLEKDTPFSVWADGEEIKQAYSFGEDVKCYKIYGEFLYFKKSDSAKSFFKNAYEIYKDRKVKCNRMANEDFTDELAYQITCMKLGVYPHAENFTPVFNIFLGYKNDLFKYPHELAKDYFALSIGGNRIPSNLKENYNILANHYFYRLGLQRPYQVQDKKVFLKERQKL
jgi:hypothetical protein